MPRVKPTATEEANRQRRAVINDVLSVRGYDGNKANISKICGFSPQTARSRYDNPLTLTIEELCQMRLTDEQILRIVTGKMPERRTVNVYINGRKIKEEWE